MERIIGMIPARYGSSRLPGKPLMKINGKELIRYVYDNAISVDRFEKVYVVTDDIRILEFCKSYGMDVIMTSNKCKSGTDRLFEAVNNYNIYVDFIVNIQGDEPLLEAKSIDKIIDYHLDHPQEDVINAMMEITNINDLYDNSVVKVVFNKNNDLIYLSRSLVPGTKEGKKTKYYRHCGLYGLKREALFFFGEKEKGIVETIEDIEMFRYIENRRNIKIIPIAGICMGIDTAVDIKKVEKILNMKG